MVVMANKSAIYYISVIVYVVFYLHIFWTSYFYSFSKASLLDVDDRQNDKVGELSDGVRDASDTTVKPFEIWVVLLDFWLP